MEMAVCSRSKGRPREFDAGEALAAALRVFWSKGYDGASLTDLTEAMGITRPSLYAAFGNKEALFRKALDLYEHEKLAYMRSAIEAPTAKGVAERLLRGAIESQCSDCEPKGCLGVISSVACVAEADAIRADVLARRKSSQRALIARFDRAKRDGDLPADADSAGLASYLFAVTQGLLVQAGSGAPRAELESILDASLAMWPGR